MSRTTEVALLGCIRILHMRIYLELVHALSTREEDRERWLTGVRSASEVGDDALFAQLPELLRSQEYRVFLDRLNDLPDASGAALIVQNLLETKEYEVRLASLRQKSYGQYVEELREVSTEELVHAITNGTVVNARDMFGEPLEIPADENYSATFMSRPTATARLEASTLLEVLNHFSSGDSEVRPHVQGLRLRQVAIVGSQLNMNWLRLSFPLGFEGCDFDSPISADYLRVPWLSFDECNFSAHQTDSSAAHGALNAQHLEVEYELRFWECQGLSQVFLPGAQIGSLSLRRPANDGAVEPRFRTVINGAHFGELQVPTVEQDGAVFPLELDEDFSLDRVTGELSAIRDWLVGSAADSVVWDSIADSLIHSGRANDAKELNIAYHRYRNSKEFPGIEIGQLDAKRPRRLKRRNPVARFFTWLFLDYTVRYMHRPMRALQLLFAVFAVTWIVAFAFHGQIIKSPLANDPIPMSWLQELGSAGAWSFMYALDSAFSPLSLGQVETMWPSSVWLLLALAALKGISLILLGLFLAAVTNIVSKRAS